MANGSAYCASKAAVIALSKSAAKENRNVRINCVAPGMWKLILDAPDPVFGLQKRRQANQLSKRHCYHTHVRTQ